MKNPIRFSQILLVCLVVANQYVFAQPIQERAPVVNYQSEFFSSFSSPIHFNATTPADNMNINISTEVLKPESGKVIDESMPTNEPLPALSDMLNQDVEARAGSDFESLRRNSIFQVESNLVSRFLGFATTEQSA